MMARRSPAAVLVVLSSLAAYCSLAGYGSQSFAGLQSNRSPRDESAIAMGDKVTRAKGKERRGKWQRQNVDTVEIEGKEMPEVFQTFLSPEEADTPFDIRQATSETVSVKFDKRPYGIVRWQPGKDFKGAMVKDVAHGVYVGDPLGQARAKGIKPGMVVKSIAGQDVMNEEFDVIMKKLGDEALGYNIFGVKFPLEVALERYYLPKLVENGAAHPVIDRVIQAAQVPRDRRSHRSKHRPGGISHTSSLPSIPRVPSAAVHVSMSASRSASSRQMVGHRQSVNPPIGSGRGAACQEPYIAGPRVQWGPVAQLFARAAQPVR
ncbi:unnamed protein product [Symbiodinium sp. CCMP2456]|nr:unnamed protein product [Symbiodinium sp. CCMP2456]